MRRPRRCATRLAARVRSVRYHASRSPGEDSIHADVLSSPLVALCSRREPRCFAQAPRRRPPDPFVGNVSLGYLATNGNTESKNANASMEATWDLDGPWKHDWTARVINARTDGITTAESYTAAYKAQRAFSETSYLFFSGDWRRDQFSGYDNQLSEAIGYGRRVIDTDGRCSRSKPARAPSSPELDDRRGARRSDRPRRARLRAAHRRDLGVHPEAPARARRRQPLYGIDVGVEGGNRRQHCARVLDRHQEQLRRARRHREHGSVHVDLARIRVLNPTQSKVFLRGPFGMGWAHGASGLCEDRVL